MRGPQVGVGAIVVHQDRVLLVLRQRPPNAGEWAIPGGKQRWGESLQAAAEREIREETGISVRAGRPVFTFEHIVHDDNGEVEFHYVVIDLCAEYLAGEPVAGDDAGAVRWVAWDELASLPLNSTTLRALAELFPTQMAQTT